MSQDSIDIYVLVEMLHTGARPRSVAETPQLS